ncbi:MAG: hypothetical protein HQL34_01910 [Alphaproteobacteria bacterium]|nr:hypothetical protein [Alphaproteobacteria bacterium]
MKTRKIVTSFLSSLLAAGLVAVWTAPVDAADINRGRNLNNRSQSKVNNTRARGYLQKDDGSGEKDTGGGVLSRGKTGCGNVSVGSTASGQKAPKEVTVVVTGDVINLGGKCK